jgi:hypothetical protein
VNQLVAKTKFDWEASQEATSEVGDLEGWCARLPQSTCCSCCAGQVLRERFHLADPLILQGSAPRVDYGESDREFPPGTWGLSSRLIPEPLGLNSCVGRVHMLLFIHHRRIAQPSHVPGVSPRHREVTAVGNGGTNARELLEELH